MRVILNPEIASGLGEDTFWTWMKRSMPESSFDLASATKDDVVLRYSALGPYEGPGRAIACCWELYPEMEARLGGYEGMAARCIACAGASAFRTVPTRATAHYYAHLGDVKVLPLGVDTELFRPAASATEKEHLRQKHGIGNGRVGFWSGTTHRMKGFDLVEAYAAVHPGISWIICWKQEAESGRLSGAKNTVQVDQTTLAELMRCADFVLSTGRLFPLFLVEWEALAAGLPLVHGGGTPREMPTGSARSEVLDMGWDRASVLPMWRSYIEEVAAS